MPKDQGFTRGPNPQVVWLHRYAIFLAVCTLFLVIAGASVTSNEAGLSVPDWPLSYGQVMPEMKGGVFYEHGHRMIASAVGFLTIVLAAWIWKVDDRLWMKWLGVAALFVVILQGVLGGMTVLYLLPKAISISHACLAQIFFSSTIAIALFTSPGWRQGATPVEDFGWPSLRQLAALLPVLVLVQVALGAAFRHRATGVLPHIFGAIVVTGFILLVSIFVLVQFGNHIQLRRSALALLSLTCVQVVFGIAAYLVRLGSEGTGIITTPLVAYTVTHVAVGALTVAAAFALAIQIFRHVRPRLEEAHPGNAPAVSQ